MGLIAVLEKDCPHFWRTSSVDCLVMGQLSDSYTAAIMEGRDPNNLADLAGMFSRLVDELHDEGRLDDQAVARVIGLDQSRVRGE